MKRFVYCGLLLLIPTILAKKEEQDPNSDENDPFKMQADAID